MTSTASCFARLQRCVVSPPAELCWFRERRRGDDGQEERRGGRGPRGREPVVESVVSRCRFLRPAETPACCLSVRVGLTVTLGCPSSESSTQSLSVFNKAGLLDLVVQCLERHPHNIELATSAGRNNSFALLLQL